MMYFFHVIFGIVKFIFIGLFKKIFNTFCQNEKNWVKSFIIYFVTKKIEHEHDPKTAKNFIKRLISGCVNFDDQQSILIHLNDYLSKTGEPQIEPDDFYAVIKAMPRVLSFELAGYNCRAALKSYLVQECGTVDEKQFRTLTKEMANDKGVGDKVELTLLKFRLDRVFQNTSGKDICPIPKRM